MRETNQELVDELTQEAHSRPPGDVGDQQAARTGDGEAELGRDLPSGGRDEREAGELDERATGRSEAGRRPSDEGFSSPVMLIASLLRWPSQEVPNSCRTTERGCPDLRIGRFEVHHAGCL